MEKIRLGISTCLLGEPVRYDGGHKLDTFLRDTLGRYVEYIPVCPEVECGFGIPREAMRLVADPRGSRLVTIRSGIDYTDRMLNWARKRVADLAKEDLCGFIFKSASPSSGMERVKVYGAKGVPIKNGVGLFAGVFMENFPLLPVEDEGRLNDPDLRENFIERIFALKAWRESMRGSKIAGAVVDYHTRNKLLILSHSPKHYQAMGKLVADSGRVEASRLKTDYEVLLMEALRIKSTPAKHANVLQHMLGYFKHQISPDEKQELLEIIDQHRQGILPLIVPITLLQHYVRRFDQIYLKHQTYVHPHPLELKLRNHV
jgi:uncharacterized protein YbgA (DUF1722 family)/uncharacterized protein YbbK (DUF523 family)